MADKLKINGNFLVIFEDVSFVEYIRNVVAETTYKRLDQDNFSFLYKAANVANTDDLFILGGDYTKFLYSDLINDVTGLAFTSGDDLDDFLADKLASAQVNVVVQKLPPVPQEWFPSALNLGAFTPNGVSIFPAAAGLLFTFDNNQNDEILGNIDLDKNGNTYSGESLLIHIHWQLFAAPSAGNNVKWEIDYAFLSDGQDNYTKIDGTLVLDLPVESRIQREQYTDVFAPIAGIATSKVLQLTIRRNGQGGGSDNYAGDADLYAVGIIKTI